MKKLWIGIGIVVIVALAIVFSVTQTKKKPEEIKIGAILPLTGPVASLGEWIKNGHLLAAEDINSNGGINGERLKLIFEDSGDDPKLAVAAFKKLVEVEKVKIIITTRSPVGLSLAPLADKYKVILFADVAHPEITGKSKFVFRHSNTADQEANLIINFIKSKRIKSVILSLLNDDYGLAFDKYFRENLKKTIANLNKTIFFEKTEADFKTIAQKIARQNPEAVIIGGSGKGLGTLTKRLREYHYKGVIISTLFFSLPNIQKAAGEAALGVYYTNFDIDYSTPQVVELNKKHNKKFGKDIPIITLLEYNDIYLLAYIINKVGYNPLKISDALLKLGSFSAVGEKMTILPNGDIVPLMKITKVEKILK